MLFLALSTIIYPPSQHLPGSTESKEGMYHTLQAFIMSLDCSLASLWYIMHILHPWGANFPYFLFLIIQLGHYSIRSLVGILPHHTLLPSYRKDWYRLKDF